jgi:beta-phosphoglucomutase-like phosphatase (HAD superfamily)
MDRVLVDSEPYWQRIWQETVFAAVADGDPSMDEVTGCNYRESFHDLADTYGLPREVKHFAHQFETAAERIYGEKVSLIPSIPGLFHAVRDRGRALGVVSSVLRAWIETVADRFALDPLDLVLSAAALDGPGKPAPGSMSKQPLRLALL